LILKNFLLITKISLKIFILTFWADCFRCRSFLSLPSFYFSHFLFPITFFSQPVQITSAIVLGFLIQSPPFLQCTVSFIQSVIRLLLFLFLFIMFFSSRLYSMGEHSLNYWVQNYLQKQAHILSPLERRVKKPLV
jgi:hypothetical protein